MNIVSLAPSNTEILYRIGTEEDVVATTSLCNYPEEAAKKPSIGGWTNPDIDRVKNFDPDIVIASDDLQDGVVEKLEDENLPIFQVKPHTMEEVFGSIKEIGEKVDRIEETDKLIEEMKNKIEDIELEGPPRIYCEEWMNPPMVSGNWIPGLIERIGGQYFIDEGERSHKFDLEKLKEFDPEYIFLNVCGAGENLSPDQVIEREGWQDITAVKNENVYVIDDDLLNRPGPRLVKAAKIIEDRINS